MGLTAQEFPELGCYVLPGGAADPRSAIGEVRTAEELGLGTAFISERWNVKELASLSGALGAVTSRIRIATGSTNINVRHPVVTAAWASTQSLMTDGRFVLGVGRGVSYVFDLFGLRVSTTAELADFAGLMRRLWNGEVVQDHDGPLGRYPMLALDRGFRLHIPLALVAFGPRSLELAGRAFDEVVLHTFFADETLQRCVRAVKTAAERAGRDPDAVRVWSVFATLPDDLSDEEMLRRSVGRMATYLQVYGDLLVRTNDWDPAALERFRAHPIVQSYGSVMLDGKATVAELETLADVIPAEWLAPAAYGSPEQCAAAVARQRELGADAVILHGVEARDLTKIVSAYRPLR
jgi:probable F420-dependent oxidoreductase